MSAATAPRKTSKIQVLSVHGHELSLVSSRDAQILLDSAQAVVNQLSPLVIRMKYEIDAVQPKPRVQLERPESDPHPMAKETTAPEGAEILSSVARLTRDLKNATATMSRQEARYLVDTYYQMQHNRIRAGNQVFAMKEEPHQTLGFFKDQAEFLESEIKRALDAYSLSTPVGRWLRSICGIGPVMAAGFMAHIDIGKADTAGSIWRHAGLDNTVIWKGQDDVKAWIKENHKGPIDELFIRQCADHWGRNQESLIHLATTDFASGEPVKLTLETLSAALARRPWNAKLKKLCWLAGESFVKVKGRDSDVYGKVYEVRKAYELGKNARGEYAETTAKILESKNWKGDTKAKKAYQAGIIPEGHMHERCKRYAVKTMLSHLQYVWWKLETGTEPKKPFAIAILNHAHLVPVPNLEVVGLA